MESLPDINVAINPCTFHHFTTKIVVRKLFTNRQTNKQTNKQTNRQTNKQGVKTIPPQILVLEEVIIIIITRGISLIERKPPSIIDYALCIISRYIFVSFP